MPNGFNTSLFKPDRETKAALKRGQRKCQHQARGCLPCTDCGRHFRLYQPHWTRCKPCQQSRALLLAEDRAAERSEPHSEHARAPRRSEGHQPAARKAQDFQTAKSTA